MAPPTVSHLRVWFPISQTRMSGHRYKHSLWGVQGDVKPFPNVTPCPNMLRGALSNTTSPGVKPKVSLMFQRRKMQ